MHAALRLGGKHGSADRRDPQQRPVSAPQSVSVVSSLPSVFHAEPSGQGPGIICILRPDGSCNLAGANNPALAGDILELLLHGLGDTTLAQSPDSRLPLRPLLWAIDQVHAHRGGRECSVSFMA